MKTIIVYDGYDIEAVILTAIIQSTLIKDNDEDFICQTINDNIYCNAEKYIWVGINPQLYITKILNNNAEHILAHIDKINQIIDESDDFNCNSWLYLHYKNTIAFTKSDEISNQLILIPEEYITNELFTLSLAIEKFNLHYKDMRINPTGFNKSMANIGLNELALIYSNWKEALHCIYSKEKYFPIQGNHVEYLNHLKMIKASVRTRLKFISVKHEGNLVSIPVMNSNMSEAPWVIKFLSIRYKYGLLYEFGNKHNVYIPWSTDGKIMEYIHSLGKQLNNNHDIIFAGHYAG